MVGKGVRKGGRLSCDAVLTSNASGRDEFDVFLGRGRFRIVPRMVAFLASFAQDGMQFSCLCSGRGPFRIGAEDGTVLSSFCSGRQQFIRRARDEVVSHRRYPGWQQFFCQCSGQSLFVSFPQDGNSFGVVLRTGTSFASCSGRRQFSRLCSGRNSFRVFAQDELNGLGMDGGS